MRLNDSSVIVFCLYSVMLLYNDTIPFLVKIVLWNNGGINCDKCSYVNFIFRLRPCFEPGVFYYTFRFPGFVHFLKAKGGFGHGFQIWLKLSNTVQQGLIPFTKLNNHIVMLLLVSLINSFHNTYCRWYFHNNVWWFEILLFFLSGNKNA